MSSRREALESILGENGPDSSTNASLWLDKCLREVQDKGPGRQKHFDQLTAITVSAEYRRFFQRWRNSVLALEPCTLTEEAVVFGRMAVGLGAESVLETAVALHRTYGVPYIPGSALKGLAAAAAHKHLEDCGWRKAGDDQPIGPSHRIVFGDQESSGYVTFHDALWIPNGDKLPLDLDVMTVHHPDYYQGKANAPAADWDSPNPVAFVTAQGRYLLAVTGPQEWTENAMEILKQALEEDGIGAKTAAGYGRMRTAPKPEKVPWKLRVQNVQVGNADREVPRLLNDYTGEDRAALARALIERLTRRTLRDPKHREKDWVKMLLAAETPSP